MITNFKFNDIVLYAKGWYKHSDDIDADLGYLLSKIYGWTPTKVEDIAHFMLIILEHVYETQGKKFSSDYLCSFTSFWNELERYSNLYQCCTYNRAIILLVLSRLQELSKDEIKLNPPHFGKKEHFRLGMAFGEYPISQTYKEMNRITQKFFNNL